MKKILIISLILIGLSACNAPGPEEISAKLELLKSNLSRDSVEMIQDQLVRWGPAVIPSIRDMCQSVEQPVLMDRAQSRQKVCRVLGSFPGNEEAIQLLIDLSQSPDPYVRREAINGLGRVAYEYTGDQIIPVLVRIIGAAPVELQVREKNGASGRIMKYSDFRETAVRSLGLILQMSEEGTVRRKQAEEALQKAAEYPELRQQAQKYLQ